MAIAEELLGYSRWEILEKFSEHVSSIDSVHRIMNDPLVKAYRDELRALKVEKALEKRFEAEKIIQDALPDIAQQMITLAKSAQSENVRAKAGRDVMYMGGFKPTDDNKVQSEIPHLAVYDNRVKKQVNDDEDE